MQRTMFPFSALVGQEPMKTGLILNAIDPGIGGILISGHKGTGKSTAVRALSRILPGMETVKGCPYNCPPAPETSMCPACREQLLTAGELETVRRPMPLVELPLSATEDRVIGTLHVETMIRSGERRFEPGLLAAANRGILYVDEVNLLDDHLVDILLDAAASGVNTVEREGVSFSHPARFILVGTMNPEEGDLRPQFLDRFGLSLRVTGVSEPLERQRIVERSLAFAADPRGFFETYQNDETLLSEQLDAARANLERIRVPREIIGLSVALAAEVQAQGHRAEIAIIRAARALAAFVEREEIGREHIVEAARYVLPHRLTTLALATPEMAGEKVEEILRRLAEAGEESGDIPDGATPLDEWEDIDEQVPGSTAASNVGMLFTFLAEKKKSYTRPTN